MKKYHYKVISVVHFKEKKNGNEPYVLYSTFLLKKGFVMYKMYSIYVFGEYL
jgi:hypothetical protein